MLPLPVCKIFILYLVASNVLLIDLNSCSTRSGSAYSILNCHLSEPLTSLQGVSSVVASEVHLKQSLT